MMILVSLLLLLGQQKTTPSPEYIVGIQDRLAITVFDEPSLTRTVTIDTDGGFDFPHIGRVTARGFSVRQIETEMKKRLGPPSGVLVNPQVTIEVERYRSQMVYVTGFVRNPRAVSLTGSMTVMEALAEAGSTTTDAGPYIELYRRPAGATPSGPVDVREASAPAQRITMDDLRSGRAAGIMLQDGDTIHVPKAQTFIVTGHVRQPGTFVLDGEVTVQKALAMAGGVTERGAGGRVRITRTINGKVTELKNVKPTLVVLPNDTIHVPQRFF